MKTIITTCTLFVVLALAFTSTNAQENKDKKEKPPQIQIQVFIQPWNNGVPGNIQILPVDPRGAALFLDPLLGLYDFGILMIPPPMAPPNFQIPLPPPPLQGLSLMFQAVVLDPKDAAKPPVSIQVETKDGKKVEDDGKGKAKVKATNVAGQATQQPNGVVKVDLGQFNINGQFGEANPKLTLTVDIKLPKERRHDTR